MTDKRFSRRTFITAAGAATGASLLAACSPAPAATEIVPTAAPAPVVIDVWCNTDVPDLAALEGWKGDPENEFFKKNWNWGGLAYTKFTPFV